MPVFTLEDVARKAGVSRSTVSRVVNKHPNVRDDVRERVLAVIKKTGYHPNAAARSLVSQRSEVLGLVLPRSVQSFFADPYFPRLTQGIAQACNQNNYTLALFLFGTKEDEERLYPRISRRGLLDGIIVQSAQMGEELILRLAQENIPLVMQGRPAHVANVSYVDVDNVTAAHMAVSHLLGLGYQRVGTITGPLDTTVGLDRLEGYRKALTERGMEVDDNLIVEADFTEVSGYQALQRLLPARPRAVFVASDTMALGAMRAIREAGLKVPNDVAIVGFDDLPPAIMIEPPLTTVRQPVHQLGMTAVATLLDIIENGVEPTRRIILNTELIVRDSCGASQRAS
jgi:LacI family transcriptional regulator